MHIPEILPGAVSVPVPVAADLMAIARAAGQPGMDMSAVVYDAAQERLYVAGVTQDALDAAVAAVGAASPARPAIHAAFETRIAAGLPVAGRAGAVQIDPDGRRELTGAALMASLGAWPEGGFWRLSDNTTLPLTGPQVVALGVAAAGRYQHLFAVRSALLDAAATGATVDPEAGWPDASPFTPA